MRRQLQKKNIDPLGRGHIGIFYVTFPNHGDIWKTDYAHVPRVRGSHSFLQFGYIYTFSGTFFA